jgi:hypothetical protein
MVTRPQSAFRRAVRYGVIAGGFGGALWFLTLMIVVPEEERYVSIWWGIGIGGTLFWLLLAFVIGFFASRPSQRQDKYIEPRPRRSLLASTFYFFGQFLYRFLIGWLIASLVGGVCACIGLGISFVWPGILDGIRGTFVGLVLVAGFGGACWGLTGGSVAASLAAKQEPARRFHLPKWACLGSLMGLVVGANIGAGCLAVSWAVVGDKIMKNAGEDIIVLPLFAGLLAGTLAGVLTGVWSRRERPEDENPFEDRVPRDPPK